MTAGLAGRRAATAEVALASFVGTAIDYFIYGMAAAVVFRRVFFPAFSPASGTVAAFATYSVDEQFAAWGWQLPFLAGALLVLVGLLIRFTTIRADCRVALRAVLRAGALQRDVTGLPDRIHPRRRLATALNAGSNSSIPVIAYVAIVARQPRQVV